MKVIIVCVFWLQAAHSAGAKVSLDLASFEVVRNCWPHLQSLLQQVG
jgi:hypothetical protein